MREKGKYPLPLYTMTEQQGIRKAAVFLNGLDRETAGMLLKRLPAEESRAIRREMVAVEGISPSEINKTVRQFLKDTGVVWPEYRHDKSNTPKKPVNTQEGITHKTVFSADGVDRFELTSRAEHVDHEDVTYPAAHVVPHDECEVKVPVESETESPIAEPAVAETPAEPQPRRFDYLERRSAFDTAVFLAEESGQLIAVVLSQLTPRYSGDMLACFEQSLKRDLIRRLAKLDAMDETILDEIDEVLKDRLKREVEDCPKSKPGLALLEQILQVVENELNNDISNDIISGLNEIDLEEQQAAYYEQCDEYLPAYDTYESDSEYIDTSSEFEDWGMLDDHELGELFRSMDRDVVVQTLLSGDAYFVERVLGLFPVYEQITLRAALLM